MTRTHDRDEARRLRHEGLSVREIRKRLAISGQTVYEWCRGIVPTRKARVDWDRRAKCWRIYALEPINRREKDEVSVRWWPLEWMQFATREVAQDHLDRYGYYSGKSA